MPKFKIISLIALSIILFSPIFSIQKAEAESYPENSAVIYYNEACGDCGIYVKQHLPPILKSYGYTDITLHDYINDKPSRVEMNKRLDSVSSDFPYELESHIMTFVGNKVILAGHIPDPIINYLLKPENQKDFSKIIVYQDEMHRAPTSYKVWAFAGPIKEYSINTPVTEYLNYFKENKSQFQPDTANTPNFLLLVLGGGLANGFHPCAIAVLLFFLSLLYTIKRSRKEILKIGIAYIAAMYLTYFLIGAGILRAIIISDTPMIMGKVGSLLVIMLGAFNLAGYFWPQMPRVKIPRFAAPYFSEWMRKATIPAAAIAGALVALCAFPCSGGIYLAILSMISSKVSQSSGLAYLAIYNLMFIFPLVAILAVSHNRKISEKLQLIQAKNAKKMNFYASISMILIGLIIWVFFL